jgi:hypothetical protein
VRRICAANFPAESDLSAWGSTSSCWEPDLLVVAILGRRIADVYQAHVSMDTRAGIVGREGPGRTSYGRRL